MDQRFAILAAMTCITTSLAAQGAPRTEPSVDLKQYAGTYYEIARFPNRFQEQCAGDVTATYAIRADGRIDVFNRCRLADGTIDQAVGIAKKADEDGPNSRLKVRFAPAILSFLPKVWGDYWILATGPGYSYAVVGTPARDYLWILARQPDLPPLVYTQAIEIAKANGYEVERLVKTQHTK